MAGGVNESEIGSAKWPEVVLALPRAFFLSAAERVVGAMRAFATVTVNAVVAAAIAWGAFTRSFLQVAGILHAAEFAHPSREGARPGVLPYRSVLLRDSFPAPGSAVRSV